MVQSVQNFGMQIQNLNLVEANAMDDYEIKAREVCMTSLSNSKVEFDNKAYTFCQKAIDVGDIKWDTSEEDITTMYGYYNEKGFI